MALNKPEKLNALSMTMVRGMWDAIEQHWSVRERRMEVLERLTYVGVVGGGTQ